MIVIRPLKHGSISVVHLADPATRDVLMRFNENVLTLAEQLREVQQAVQALERQVSGLSAKVYALENP